ncbi:MAG: alpha-D-ribose 1-methylphosphonate 5-triphosphate diphosphatase [Alphaproteobacteria bacterium]|nr:alpha-D-ribose 1-methylphosphonate 5-triphosphate diphosphatase [Alphaproteobacteria bacterium]
MHAHLPLVIDRARLLLPSGEIGEGALTIAEGRIQAIGSAAAAGSARRLDAAGLLLAPGLIDLHGDAFERQIQPRPGVGFPVDLAMLDTDAQLGANGITTAYLGITLSWEPGLRSLETWRAILAALDRLRPRLGCDMRVHLRFETFALDALEQAEADVAAGRVHLVAFNDHTPSIARRSAIPEKAVKFSERARMGVPEFRSLAEGMLARAPEVPAAIERMAAAGRAAGIPMASHDDADAPARIQWRARGCTICEFPTTEGAAREAHAQGETVVMGSPNVVRGASHIGWITAADMVAAGLCDVLTSDYFYPALLQAPFRLAERGILPLGRAWALVSANAARAAGLADRGAIAPGQRADLVLVDDRGPGDPRIAATLVAGQPVDQAAGTAITLG